MTITIIIEDEGATAYDGAIGFWILFQQIHIVQSSWLVASIAHLEGLPTRRQCLANLS
jgi:hypothetical protein